MLSALSSLIMTAILVCMQLNSFAKTAYDDKAQILSDTVKKSNKYVDALIDRLFQSLQKPVQIKNNRFRDQLVMIDSALEMEPSHISALHLQAQIFANLKEHDKAIAILSKTISYHPHLSKLYVFRGALYDTQGKKSNAKKDYQKTLQLINSSVDSLADGNQNKLFLTGTASILELLLGGVPLRVLSAFDRRVAGTYEDELTERVRRTIETFDKEEFLASYKRGNL